MAVTTKHFDRSTFVSEFAALCQSLDAPYSQQVTEQILAAFDEHLDNSYVWLRCTSKPGDVVNFRLAFHGRWIDTVSIAAKAGWINIDDPLPQVARSWSLRGGAEQWCDFDPSAGLAKTWIYFHHLQPIEDILRTTGLPAAVAARLPDLQAAVGSAKVNFAAVDYSNKSMNIYFLLPGGLTSEQAARYTGLSGSKALPDAEIQTINDLTQPMQTFGVTIMPETGHIPRVAFYAAMKDADTFSPLNERMRKFFREAPSHDPQKLHIVSWSYGAGDSKTYHKGEASYSGFSEEFSRDMFLRWMEDVDE